MQTQKKLIRTLLLILIVLTMILGALLVKNNFDQKNAQSKVEEPETEEVVKEDYIETITLMSVGDFLYHRPQVLRVESEPTGYDYYNNLQYVKPYLEAADITFANYESTSTLTRGFAGYPSFNTPPESIDAIYDAGIDIVNVANNHTLDSGKVGLVDTHLNLYNRGVIPVGTKLSPNEKERVIVRKGIHVGFLAYTYGFNGLDSRLTEEEHTYMAAKFDVERMEKEIKASVKRNDFTVVSMHWGNEYQIIPTQEQRDLAELVVSWGADVIIGGHPHVIQESDRIDNSYVIYSTGNFISDQRLETLDKIETERGIMVELELSKNFTTGETHVGKSTVHPTWVNKYLKEGRSYYEIIPTSDYLSGKINPYTPAGSRERIQSAYDAIMERVGE